MTGSSLHSRICRICCMGCLLHLDTTERERYGDNTKNGKSLTHMEQEMYWFPQLSALPRLIRPCIACLAL